MDDFHIHHLTFFGQNVNKLDGGQIKDGAAYSLLALSLFTVVLATFVFKLVIQKEREDAAAAHHRRRDNNPKHHHHHLFLQQ